MTAEATTRGPRASASLDVVRRRGAVHGDADVVEEGLARHAAVGRDAEPELDVLAHVRRQVPATCRVQLANAPSIGVPTWVQDAATVGRHLAVQVVVVHLEVALERRR